MITPIQNHYTEIALARQKLYKNRLQGPILPFIRQAIINSITNRWLLRLDYEGDNQNSAGSRYVQPYVYGLNRFTGNEIIRVYQLKGDTTTIAEGWKTFRLDRCRGSNPLTTKVFNKPEPLYNPNGDFDMSAIMLQIQFPDEPRA